MSIVVTSPTMLRTLNPKMIQPNQEMPGKNHRNNSPMTPKTEFTGKWLLHSL